MNLNYGDITVDLTKEEAKTALIAMTKDGMKFEARKGASDSGEPEGVLVFKDDNSNFWSAYEKIAEAAGYKKVDIRMTETFSHRGNMGSEYDTQIVKSSPYKVTIEGSDLVKDMCKAYPDIMRKGRGSLGF